MKFKDYTQLWAGGKRDTEYMDKKIKSQVTRYLNDAVRKNPKLKFEVR